MSRISRFRSGIWDHFPVRDVERRDSSFSSPEDGWAGGGFGYLYHWDGSSWHLVEDPTLPKGVGFHLPGGFAAPCGPGCRDQDARFRSCVGLGIGEDGLPWEWACSDDPVGDRQTKQGGTEINLLALADLFYKSECGETISQPTSQENPTEPEFFEPGRRGGWFPWEEAANYLGIHGRAGRLLVTEKQILVSTGSGIR